MKALLVIFLILLPLLIFSQEEFEGSSISDSMQVRLTEKEKQWLKKHPVIRVGSDPDWAPIEFRNKNGEYSGIIIDYLRYIEQVLGIKFQFAQDETWFQMVEKAKKKKLDLISNITETPERSKGLNFTEPVIVTRVSIFAHEDVHYIRDMAELNGQKVAVVKGYFFIEYLSKDYPEIKVVLVKNIEEGLKKLHKNEVYAFMEGMLPGSYYAIENKYQSIRIVGESPYEYKLSMGVRKDWPILAGILQKVLDAMPDSQKNSIYYNWIPMKTSDFNYALLWKILIPLFFVFLFILYWNRKLSVEIKKRKMAQAELNEAFKKLKDTQTHLVQTEKLASIGLLTAGIAHEINNPLNFISFGIERIKETTEALFKIIDNYEMHITERTDVEVKEFEKIKEEFEYDLFKDDSSVILGHLQEGTERITEIVKSLNSFSRVADNEKSLANVNDGIESALILLKNQYKYDIEIIKQLENLPEIKCYPGKLNQVFVNMIANSIQAIEKRGTIWLTTSQVNDSIRISIKDNGSGIEKEKLDKIFDSFYTTKPPGQGTGLGLAISKNIIDEHNGTIEVNSEKGVGTEFIITLPIG